MSRNLSTKTAQPVEKADPSTLDAQGFMEAIRHALAVGDHKQAQRLATQGARLYPKHKELTKMAYILERTVVTRTKSEHEDPARLNQIWLQRNFEQYKGKWVALRKGEVLGIADSVSELRAIVSDITDAMLTIV